MSEQKNKLSLADFEKIETNKDLLNILESKKISLISDLSGSKA